jgi:hypothetical protein
MSGLCPLRWQGDFRRALAYARRLRRRAIPLLISGHEERQLRLALAAQDVEVDLDLGAGG